MIKQLGILGSQRKKDQKLAWRMFFAAGLGMITLLSFLGIKLCLRRYICFRDGTITKKSLKQWTI